MNNFFHLTAWLKGQSQYVKISITSAADYLLLNIMLLAAYMIRLSDMSLPPADKLATYLIAPVLSIAAGMFMGVYHASVRSYSSDVEKKIIVANLLGTGAWVIALFPFGLAGFARSVVVIYFVLAVFGMLLSRRLVALLFRRTAGGSHKRSQTPIVIFGAGHHGQAVAEALRSQNRYRPTAFLDEDPTLIGRMVSGLRVHALADGADIVELHGAKEAIVAEAGLERSRRRRIVEQLVDCGLMVKIAPDMDDVFNDNVKIGSIRPILVEDLLGRDSVPPNQSLIDTAIAEKTVMITGAGGSIGSELVRQAFSSGPKLLLLVENNEFSLFEIRRELERRQENLHSPKVIAILADVQDESRMFDIMEHHSVDIVFHAAAYKHVRLVQENAAAGIRNNVMGTLAVARAAIKNKVKRFVLISTDKAVRPTSVMGASKRVAEMVIQALAAEQSDDTCFSIVRFGNVLGSTGSVVPLFRQQIDAGGPVLVTHPEVTRYFMLIPEAAQLVIQAAALAEGGEVYVLDMGEPIKILHLARTMIDIAGLSEKTVDDRDGDIEIKFIGLGEGEKLHEELQIGDNASKTVHPRITKCQEHFLSFAALKKQVLSKLVGASSEAAAVDVVMKAANLKP